MTTVSTKTLALAGAVGMLVAGTARADVIYTLSGKAPGQYFPITISLDFTNAQVASGSFTLRGSGQGGYNPVEGIPLYGFSGDVGGFVEFNILEPITPTYIYGSITANVAFGSDDSITSLNINYMGSGNGADITGTGANATVAYGSDDPQICNGAGNACTITGAFTVTSTSSVPEPASFASLGVALIGLGLAHRAGRQQQA